MAVCFLFMGTIISSAYAVVAMLAAVAMHRYGSFALATEWLLRLRYAMMVVTRFVRVQAALRGGKICSLQIIISHLSLRLCFVIGVGGLVF